MDFDWTPEQADLRARAREVATDAVARFGRHNDSWINGYSDEFAKQMASLGWIGLTWPTEFGGGGRPAIDRLIIAEELISAGAPVAAMWFADRQMGPTLIAFGRPDQQQEFLPGILAGDSTWCIGMSEPEAGSDLASLKTSARRDGDDWIINGQKIWTSFAAVADYCYCICRTSSEGPPHAGISEIIVPMSTPGIEVRPITDMTTNRHFCEVFFTDVRVPGVNLVGVEGNAFKQTMRQLEHERGGIDRLVSNHALFQLALERVDTSDPLVRQEVARLETKYRIGRILVTREVLKQAPAGFSAATKCFCTEHEQDVAEFVGRAYGAEATLWSDISKGLVYAPGYTIMGGTSNVMRNILGERVLGLPREPALMGSDIDAPDINRIHFVPGTTGPAIVGGDGVWLHTADGRRILDGAGGAIVSNIGHGRVEVADAVRDALDGGAYVIPIWPTPHRERLHDVLVERWLPDGMGHVFFTSGGSESADSAIRLARAYHLACGRPERWKVVGRHPSYHGLTLGALAVGSHRNRRAGFEPILPEFPHVPWDDAAALEELIETEGADTIAAFLFEPITGAAGGCLVPSDDYWRRVSEVCRRNEILLIADEVMTGFGRTGLTWGHQHFSLAPDVIYGGKGLGGGYVPIGMVAATDAIVDALRGHGFMFFTFTGSDAMCAGAATVLEILEREHLVERAAAMGDVLGERLHDALGSHPAVVEIRGRGMFRGIELRPSGGALAQAVVAEALARDLWVYPAGSGPPVPDAVMLGPAFTIADVEVDALVERLTAALDAAATRA